MFIKHFTKEEKSNRHVDVTQAPRVHKDEKMRASCFLCQQHPLPCSPTLLGSCRPLDLPYDTTAIHSCCKVTFKSFSFKYLGTRAKINRLGGGGDGTGTHDTTCLIATSKHVCSRLRAQYFICDFTIFITILGFSLTATIV